MSQANDLEQTPDIVEKPDDGGNVDGGGNGGGNLLDGQHMDGASDHLTDGDDGLAAEPSAEPKADSGLAAAVDNVNETLGVPNNGNTTKSGEQGDQAFGANKFQGFFASETAYNSENDVDQDSQFNSENENQDEFGLGQAGIAQVMEKYQMMIADHERIEIELGEQIQELNDRVFTLENLNNSKDNEIRKLEEKLETALNNSTGYQVLQTKFKNLEEQNEQLLEQLQKMKDEDYPGKIRNFENKIAKNEQVIENLRNESGRLQKSYDAINLKLMQTIEQKNQNDGQLAIYSKENEDLKKRHDELNSQYTNLLNSFNDLKKKYTMLQTYTKQQALIINQLSKLVPNIERLTETFAGIQLNEKEIDNLTIPSSDGDGKLYSHLGRLSNASDILQNTDFGGQLQKEAEIEQYKDQVDEMKEDLNEKNTKIQMLQNSLDNLAKNDELLANYNSLQGQYGLMSKQVSALHEAIVNLTKQVSDRDQLIKAMVNDKYETVSVLSKQLDFLRNLIKKHNLSINLTSDSTENPGFLDKIGLGALTSWMTAGGTTTGEEDIDTPMATEEDIAGQ